MNTRTDRFSEDLVEALREWVKAFNDAVDHPASRTVFVSDAAFARLKPHFEKASVLDRTALFSELGAGLVLAVLRCLESGAPRIVEGLSMGAVRPLAERTLGPGLADKFMDAVRSHGLIA